ncbi:DUF6734 family protein [Tenacibaculum sp. 190524A05c]|uniref:DUF6734 family protein n=1 Tax=Tenacibaculum platacis TaxID=3137852 RepID=UPI0032B1B024
MKVIQSFWSKPSMNQSNDPNSRFKGGWLKQKYSFYSQALSCLTFKQFYNDVELYTDTKGKELLIDQLNLPYSKTHITLDKINSYNPKLWALGKIVSYAEQTEPFLHADSDVFIWEKFPEEMLSSQLFTQNIEVNFPAYQDAFNDILINFDWIPTELINSLYKNQNIHAFNAGIIGGQNHEFFRLLKEKVLSFIDENVHLFEKIDVGIFNTIFEQQLGFALAEKNNIPIHYYLQDVDSDFSKVINFHTVPFDSKYVHCIGYAKKSEFACEQLEARLQYHFPDFYTQLNDNLKSAFPDDNFDCDFPTERMDHLFKIYSWLETKTIEDIFNSEFQLNPKVNISEDNGRYYIEYPLPQNGTLQREEIKDWLAILLYFEQPTSIKQLYNELCLDEDFLKDTNKDELKDKLISYVMDKFMLLEILKTEF